jgi:protein tyrosine phosphatase
MTQEKDPEAPLNLHVTELTAQAIHLMWQHPSIANGRVRQFNISVKLISSHLRRLEEKVNKPEEVLQVQKPTRNYSYELKDLQPSTEYEVSVRGVTVEPGKAAILKTKTSLIAPAIGSQLNLGMVPTNTTTIPIIIPAGDQFLTKNSCFYVFVTSDKAEMEEHDFIFVLEPEILKKAGLEPEILKKAGIEKDGRSWIAAKIQPPDKEQEFIVGDNSSFTGGFWNLPLTPGRWYQVTLVAVNWQDDDYKYSFVKLQHPVQTLAEANVKASSGSGAEWAALLLLLLIPAIVYFIWRKKHMKKRGDTLELKRDNGLYGSRGDSTENVANLDPEINETSVELKLSPSQRFSRKVAIGELEKYVKDGLTSGELQRQHVLFPRGQTRPWDYGRLPQNKAKNRYGNLVAYDETRVILKKLPEDQFSDYINANYINGYNTPKFYVATQGPKRNTVVDLWRMIWQEHVQVIAMLTNVMENGKLKCEQYWPEIGQEVTHGVISILNVSTQIFADFTFRMLNVTCKGKTRKIRHLHFTSWPDHGVPLYPQSVAAYLKKVLATPPGHGPILVHCSAGVGRTGTIILADACLRMAAAEGHVDVLGLLQQIREQRANMVDNLDQYKLVHLVLLECLVAEPSSITCDGNLEKHIDELHQSGALLRQFNRMHELRWQDQALRSSSAQKSNSPVQKRKSKNRSQRILPDRSGRVFLSRYPYEDENSEYINAVYVDGFRFKDQFVVTQFPLPSTVGDFWRLIAEKSISLIVVLNEVDEKIENVCKFWPSEQQPQMNPVPYLTVTWKVEDKSLYWRTHTLHLAESNAPVKIQDKIIHILHLKGWQSNEMLPPSASVMLELWQETERLCSGKEPIVVTCLDGAKACGYFLALSFLVEKIKLEQECDVCHAVRMVRRNRENFVPTIEQFESLHEAAKTYLDSFQTYANFN